MRTIFFICVSLILVSCTNDQQKKSVQETVGTKDTTPVMEKTQPEKKIVKEEPAITDTGQTWFKVVVTRNDSSYIKYEGDWPVLLTTKGFATLAFTASKGALVVSHGVTFYIYGWPPAIGRTPIIHSASKKGETSMIMVPVENDAYGLAISPDRGFVEITRNDNDGKVISGYFEAQATNENKDIYRFKGQFLNVKPR